MKVLHKHAIYLDKVRSQIYIDVMQGDTNTRILEFSLYEGGSEWPVPAGASVAVAYRRADGRKGIYDTMADGSVAYTVAGNVVTVTLVPQALAVPGNTAATVVFTDTNGGQLATFCVILRVERNPAVGAVEPEDYYNLRQMIAAEVESLLDGVSVTGGGGSAYYFNVSSNGSSYVSDKTFAELVSAYNKGRALYCALNNNLILALVNKNSGDMVFQSINDHRYFRVTITSEDTVIAATGDYASQNEIDALEKAFQGETVVLEDLSNWEKWNDSSGEDILSYADGALTLIKGNTSNSGVRSSGDLGDKVSNAHPLHVSVDCSYSGDGNVTLYVVVDGNYSVNALLFKGTNNLTFTQISNFDCNSLFFIISRSGMTCSGAMTLRNFKAWQDAGSIRESIDQMQDDISDISDQLGMATETVRDIYVDNTLALTAWGSAKVVSAIDDRVVFTSDTTGDRGVYVKLEDAVEASKPLYVKYTADYDASLFNVIIYIFNEGGLVKAVPNSVVGSEVVQTYDLSGVDCSMVQIIIAANFKSEELTGKELSISGFRVYQEREVKISTLEEHHQRISELEVSKNFLSAPNGENYLLQVGTDGNFVMTPVVPTKALFIGNSLLLGFGSFGMAASDNQHDYYHLINQAISKKKEAYTASRMLGTAWEASTSKEEQTTFLSETLLPHLTEDLDLVIVQLGDNVNTDAKKAVFAEGCRAMLEFIRTNVPRARAVWVGAWYQTSQKREQMIAACEKTGSTFIDIWDLATAENKSAIGNTYTDANGVTQTITNAGVASHPGDAGFRAIANRVLYRLGIVDTEKYYS